MPALSHSRQNAAILLTLLVLQWFLMSDSARRHGGSPAVEGLVMRVSAPGVRAAHAVAGLVRGGVNGARNLLAAHVRNTALEVEVQQLRTELVRVREAEPENLRLRRLLGMREDLAPRSVAATIVTANLGGGTRVVVVDRGTRDGVRDACPVVAWGGAVGRVVSVDARHAKVRLLTDASSGVAGIVQRSRAQGIVEGQAGAALQMLYVPRYSDVLHGDRVVTSGLDGIFPRGFGIGRVSSIVEDPFGAQTVHIAPELEYASLEEVLILLDDPAGSAVSREGAGVQP